MAGKESLLGWIKELAAGFLEERVSAYGAIKARDGEDLVIILSADGDELVVISRGEPGIVFEGFSKRGKVDLSDRIRGLLSAQVTWQKVGLGQCVSERERATLERRIMGGF